MKATRCSIPGCTKASRERGWCPMHYARWYKWGDPYLYGSQIRGDDVARFWSYVDKAAPGGCWQWTGGLALGYEPVTARENIRRAMRTHCPQGHDFTAENTYINTDGARVCRTCGREKMREIRARKRAAV